MAGAASMRVVALDVATVCGICVRLPGEKPVAWSIDLGSGKSEDARFSAALVLTHGLLAEHKPDLVAIEAPVGGPKASSLLIGLVACIRGCCFNRRVPVQTYPINSIRRHFMGRALALKDYPGVSAHQAKRLMKQDVMRRCRMLGWEVPDDNAADACALADFACATLGAQTTPAGGLFR